MYRYIDRMLSNVLVFAEDNTKQEAEYDWETVREFLSLSRRDFTTNTWSTGYASFATKYGPLLFNSETIKATAGFYSTYDENTIAPGDVLLIEHLEDWIYHSNCLKDMVVLNAIYSIKDWNNVVVLPIIEDNMKVFIDSNGVKQAMYHGTTGIIQRIFKDRLNETFPDDIISWLKALKLPFSYVAPFEGEDTLENRVAWIREHRNIPRDYLDTYLEEQTKLFKVGDGVLSWLQQVVKDIVYQQKTLAFCNLCGEVVTSENGKNAARLSHPCRMIYYRKEDKLAETLAAKKNCTSEEAKELLQFIKINGSYYNFEKSHFYSKKEDQ